MHKYLLWNYFISAKFFDVWWTEFYLKTRHKNSSSDQKYHVLSVDRGSLISPSLITPVIHLSVSFLSTYQIIPNTYIIMIEHNKYIYYICTLHAVIILTLFLSLSLWLPSGGDELLPLLPKTNTEVGMYLTRMYWIIYSLSWGCWCVLNRTRWTSYICCSFITYESKVNALIYETNV